MMKQSRQRSRRRLADSAPVLSPSIPFKWPRWYAVTFFMHPAAHTHFEVRVPDDPPLQTINLTAPPSPNFAVALAATPMPPVHTKTATVRATHPPPLPSILPCRHCPPPSRSQWQTALPPPCPMHPSRRRSDQCRGQPPASGGHNHIAPTNQHIRALGGDEDILRFFLVQPDLGAGSGGIGVNPEVGRAHKRVEGDADQTKDNIASFIPEKTG